MLSATKSGAFRNSRVPAAENGRMAHVSVESRTWALLLGLLCTPATCRMQLACMPFTKPQTFSTPFLRRLMLGVLTLVVYLQITYMTSQNSCQPIGLLLAVIAPCISTPNTSTRTSELQPLNVYICVRHITVVLLGTWFGTIRTIASSRFLVSLQLNGITFRDDQRGSAIYLICSRLFRLHVPLLLMLCLMSRHRLHLSALPRRKRRGRQHL